MREHALRHYPRSVDDAGGTLPTPAELMDNLREWRARKAAEIVVTPGFPDNIITGSAPAVEPSDDA